MLIGTSPLSQAIMNNPALLAGFVHFFDEITGAQFGVSLKLLRSDYTGNCVKVRNSSNVDLDIGFDGDNIDEDALEAHLGGGQGFVDTWYDQQGSNNLVQASDSLQPEILKQDGLYTLKFVGGDFLESASFIGAQTHSSIHIVWKAPQDFPTGLATFQGGISVDSGNTFIAPNWTEENALCYYDGSTSNAAARWEDGSWRHHILNFTGGNYSLSEFGVSSDVSNSVQTAPNYARLQIGKHNFKAADMFVSEFAVFDNVIDQDVAAAAHFSNYSGLYSPTDDLMFILSDSLGTNAFCGGLDRTWQRKAFVSYNGRMYGQAKGGKTAQDFVTDTDEIEKYAKIAGSNKTAIIWLGTNDMYIDGTTPAATLTLLKTLAQNLKSAGFQYTIVLTALPRNQDSSFNTNRQTLNASLIADSSGDFDAVVNLASNANLEDETNATYFNSGDKTHLTEAGNAEVGALVLAAYNGLFS